MARYIGVDISDGFDYRDLLALKDKIIEVKANTIVSLFSVECTKDEEDNNILYDFIFKETDVKTILSSGFYYKSKKDLQMVKETCGIISYQTIGEVRDDELRFTVPCPSNMFGEEVVEVWRLLRKWPIENLNNGV